MKKEVELDIIKLMNSHLDLSIELDKIDIDSSLNDLGINSKDFIKLLALVELIFNISVKDISLLSPEKCTFHDCIKYIEEKLENRKNK